MILDAVFTEVDHTINGDFGVVEKLGDADKIFEAGRQAEWSDFWDAIQDKGRRTNYENAFQGYGAWGDKLFPKYDIKPTTASNAFACIGDSTAQGGKTLFDFKQRLIDCGVVLDTSNCNRIHKCFYFALAITRLPKIDLSKIEATAYCEYVFGYMRNLISIDEVVLPPSNTAPKNWFSDCKNLTDISFSGTIWQNGFDIHWSTKLSKASLKSILLACNKANAGVTITLPKKCIDGNTDTKTLLENDKNALEYFVPWDESSTIQLPNTNIIKSSVVLTTYYATGEEAQIKSYDDGEGNIRFISPTGEIIQGTIDYSTGLINLESYLEIAQGGQIKVEYQINTPYQNALANGYTIAYV